jgi:uncharacterized protein YndB with AHSA1/START domain
MSTNTSNHVYEVIVGSSVDNVWNGLTDGEMTQKYFFGSRIESDWKVGSAVQSYDSQGGLVSDGEVVKIEPKSQLQTTWKPMWLPPQGEKPSTLNWELQPLGPSTLLKLTHADIDDATFETGQMHVGWVYVISSLKTLLETGEALPTPDMFG